MSNDVSVKLIAHGETKLSLLVSTRSDQKQSVWIRKSDITSMRWLDATTVELTLPRWLAQAERLM
ncbi:hypothetical protein ACO2I3_06225 [Leptospira interrogans]